MFVIGSNSAASTGYNLTRSLRFRASASATLVKTFASGGNQKTWTLSFWVKRGTLGTAQAIFDTGVFTSSDSTLAILGFTASDTINFSAYSFSYRTTTQVFRDPSAWYHIVLNLDTTQATAANRVKLYVNGTQVTAFSSSTDPTLNTDYAINQSAYSHTFGYPSYSYGYFDGYLAEVNFVDGQALTPSSFGSTNALTGVWQPAAYTGSYGTNGFELQFTDNSALTTASNVGLGKDFSGNGNYFPTTNISITAGVTYDSMTDVPTLTSATAANFAVLNPLSLGSNAALTNGNLSGTLTGSGGWSATICGLTSGKWYYEATVTANSGNSMWVGFISDAYTKNDNNWSYGTQIALYANDARNGNNGGYGASWTTNDVIGVALDLSTSSGSITFYKNGVSQGVMFSSLTSSAAWRPLVSGGGTGTTIAMNFGQRPFTYTAPTGYVALNTYNLPTSTIVKGNTVMDATIYTGAGGTQSITNAAGFKPDFVWAKSRSNAFDHAVYDSVRGAGTAKYLITNATSAEGNYSNSYGSLSSFNSNGFTVATGTDPTNPNAFFNQSAATYVAWQWQAGQGTTSSNTSGTITSTVSVNASAGFSVVTWTGTGANATVGHGLGVAPQLIINKPRNAADNWISWHTSLGSTGYIYLNLTNASATGATVWNSTLPTSSVFSVGTSSNINTSAQTMVSYCWTPIAGFSAFGSYTGNGSSDGPFVYTGFRPKYILIKSSSYASDWIVEDSAINTYNVANTKLSPNTSNAEYTSTNDVGIDFLSNGFKVKGVDAAVNGSGQTYIYACYAENPFRNALAR